MYDEIRMTVGTHTLRKTGFLFAVFGVLTEYKLTGRRSQSGQALLQPLDDSAICCAARHQHSTKTHAYYQDASTRFVEYQMDPQLAEENRVAPWQPNFVQNDITRKTFSLDGKYDDSLEKLADDYVKKELNVDVEKVKNITYAQLIGLAVGSKSKLNSKTTKEKFDERAVGVPEEQQLSLWSCVKEACEEFRLGFAGAQAGSSGVDGDVGEFITVCCSLPFISHTLFLLSTGTEYRRT